MDENDRKDVAVGKCPLPEAKKHTISAVNGSLMNNISLNIKQSGSWIFLTIAAGEADITVHFSSLFNPLFEVFYIFWGLINGVLPQEIDVDEEGEIKVIRLLPADNDLVRLQVADYDYGKPDEDDPEYSRTYIDIETAKDPLIQEFFSKLIDFLENDFNPESWRAENLKTYILPAIKNGYISYLRNKATLA